MRILVTGGKGLLGSSISLKMDNYEVISAGKENLDITDTLFVNRVIKDCKPDIVIHCAAFTDVDGCEEEAEKAYAVNAEGTMNTAKACETNKSLMVYISTDFVFNGKKRTPYLESDNPEPVNVYGKTKLLGEYYVSNILKKFIIVRTSKIFGPGGKNFASSLPFEMQKKKKLFLATNIVSSPTYAVDLAEALKFLIEKNFCGIVNICNKGICSWMDFGKEVQKNTIKTQAELVPVKFRDIKKQAAERPAYSALDTGLLEDIGFSLNKWQIALKHYIVNINKDF